MKSIKILIFSIIAILTGSINSQTTITFNYTGSAQIWVVPPCVYSISVDVRAGKGGGANGGNGARVTHNNIAVVPGQVLQINVGGAGGIPTAGWNGGGSGANAGGSCGVVPSCGGGGASDIRVAPNGLVNRIIVAGGGGGRNGGSTNVAGGAGGCANGNNGTSSFGSAGSGGTQVSGGSGGGPWGGGASGQAGSLGQGGNGAADPCYNYGPGGGGGGGYYGGGGGGSDCFPGCPLGGGGGGGGSSFTPAGGVCTANLNNGNGIVTITYTNSVPILVATNTGPYCEGFTIQLNSTAGGITYAWTGPNGFTSNLQNPTIPLADTTMSGMYIITLTAPGGCVSIDTTIIFVNPNPLAIATNTGPYCAGDAIQLNSVGGFATDDWTGPGYVQNDVQNPIIPSSTAAMSGVYTVTIANGFACSNTATTTVVVNPLPNAVANNTGPYCEGDTINLSSSGGTNYDWNGPNGFILNNTQNTIILSATTVMDGIYTVNITDINNCTSITTTQVTVNLLPLTTATNTGPYCSGDNIILNSSGGVGYNWSGPNGYINNIQNPIIISSTTSNSGTYTVIVNSVFGCTATDSTIVLVTNLPIPIANNTGPYCEGDMIELFVTNGTLYNWNGPGGYSNIIQNPTIGFAIQSNSGVYNVTVTDGVNCSSSTSTIVVVNPTPTSVPLFSPQNPTTLYPEVNFYNSSYTNITTWIWNIDGMTYNTPSFTHTFTQSGTFNGILTVTNQWGCSDTTSLTIYVKSETSIYIPNSFTPNDDGINDMFYAYGVNWSKMDMTIFDRWGRELFTSDDPNKGWNGRINNSGDLLMQGVYVYKVNIIDFYGKEHNLIGTINLIR